MPQYHAFIVGGVMFGSLLIAFLYKHRVTTRSADPVKVLRAKAASRLIPFYAVNCTVLFMLPTYLELNIFWFEREVKTVDDLVPLLKQQGEALASMRETLYWFMFFNLLWLGTTVSDFFLSAHGIEREPDDSIPH